jgi:hypothetical protein
MTIVAEFLESKTVIPTMPRQLKHLPVQLQVQTGKTASLKTLQRVLKAVEAGSAHAEDQAARRLTFAPRSSVCRSCRKPKRRGRWSYAALKNLKNLQ